MCLHTQKERVCVIYMCDYTHKSERLSDGEGLLSLCYLPAKSCGGKHSSSLTVEKEVYLALLQHH